MFFQQKLYPSSTVFSFSSFWLYIHFQRWESRIPRKVDKMHVIIVIGSKYEELEWHININPIPSLTLELLKMLSR